MNQSISLEFPRRRCIGSTHSAIAASLFQLTHLLGAGVGLDEALAEVLALERHRQLRKVWLDVTSRIRNGQCLSDALQEWLGIFPPMVVALIRAGEANGELAAACDSARDLLEWQRTTRSRLVTALVYPAFAMLVLTGVVVFLFITVVPSLEQFLTGNDALLTWHTQALLCTSDWLAIYFLPLLGGCCVMLMALWWARRVSERVLLRSDRLMLSLPLVGALICELAVSRYAMVSGRLYRSGIELERALATGEALVGNRALRKMLEQARHTLVAGATLGDSFAELHVVPGTFRRLLAAGESAGAVGQALQRASEQHQHSATQLIDRSERMIGPVVLVLIGSSLLWIVLSVLGPVYDTAIAVVISS